MKYLLLLVTLLSVYAKQYPDHYRRHPYNQGLSQNIKVPKRTLPVRLIRSVSIDNLIDKNIENMPKAFKFIDPLELVNRTYNLKLVTLKLKDGWIKNLSNMKRTGYCGLQYYNNKQIHVILNVGWEKLLVRYNFINQNALTSMKGTFNATVFNASGTAKFVFNLKNYTLTLDKLKYNGARKMDFKVNGTWSDYITTAVLRYFPENWLIPETETVSKILINKRLKIFNEKLTKIFSIRMKIILFITRLLNGKITSLS